MTVMLWLWLLCYGILYFLLIFYWTNLNWEDIHFRFITHTRARARTHTHTFDFFLFIHSISPWFIWARALCILQAWCLLAPTLLLTHILSTSILWKPLAPTWHACMPHEIDICLTHATFYPWIFFGLKLP